MKGALRKKPIRAEETFWVVDNLKLQMTLASLADRLSEKVRMHIYMVYNDDHLASLYRGIRASRAFQHGGSSKVHRKIVDFPSAYVYDFCNTVLSALYGDDWIRNNKALKHELVRPWWVIEKL